MKPGFKLMISLAVILVVLISFMAHIYFFKYQADSGSQINFQKSIDKRLNIILSPKISSSNPYDYIQLNKSTYDSIKKEGQPAFKYLLKKLELSKNDGLESWIIAKLCNDILAKKNPVTNWSTGKEWLEKYIEITGKSANQ
jgi:hypothetical protein